MHAFSSFFLETSINLHEVLTRMAEIKKSYSRDGVILVIILYYFNLLKGNINKSTKILNVLLIKLLKVLQKDRPKCLEASI